MKTKIGQSGFTLPEIMLSMAILGIISLAGMQVMSNISSNENYSRAQTEISKKVGQIENILSSKKSCVMLLKNVKSNAKLSELALTRPSDGVKNIILQDGSSYGEYFLESGNGNENASIFLKKSEINANTLELVLNFKTKKKILLNATEMSTTITKRISFMAAEAPGGGIIDCGILVGATNLSAAEKACLSLGDLATWDDSKCNLNSFSCPYGEVMQGLEQLGQPTCVSLKSKFLLSDLFEMTPKNCVNKPDYSFFINHQGKVEIRCDGLFTPPVLNRHVTCQSDCETKISETCMGLTVVDKCGNTCSGTGTKSCDCSKGPVDGGLSEWSDWSVCTPEETTQFKIKTCTNPTPSCGGLDCSGERKQTRDCPCTRVDGKWSEWSEPSSCENKIITRKKTCIEPKCGGAPCDPNEKIFESKPCGLEKNLVGTALVKCGETALSYWTTKKVPTGTRLWSGGHVCYISGGEISEEEKPVGGTEIFGTPQACTCDNGNHSPSPDGN